jgi:hypothetical protein
MKLRFFLVALVIGAAAGCDDNGARTTSPSTGTLEITTATTGDPAADYTVIVDGASPRAIAANATLSIADVPGGSHIIQLTLPTNCSIEGDNPRTVSVTPGATTTVDFAITCSAS